MIQNNFQRQSLQDLATALEKGLKAKAPKSSGKLKQSIKATATDDEVTVEMLYYAAFIDKGVDGTENNRGSIFRFNKKKPPTGALNGFGKRTGISPFALHNSIFEKGIKPTNFIARGTGNIINNFAQQFGQAIWDDFKESSENDIIE